MRQSLAIMDSADAPQDLCWKAFTLMQRQLTLAERCLCGVHRQVAGGKVQMLAVPHK